MPKIASFIKKHYKEIVLQISIHIVMFLFYSYNQNSPTIFGTAEAEAPYKIPFFLNYASGAFVINYLLLPTFFYKRKFLIAFILFCLVITGIILVDEFFLEQIYFPDTRGAYFPGVAFSLAETLPIIIIFMGAKLAWDFNKKQLENESLKNAVKESELQFLKTQINPHFLFNNLNNLYSYALEMSPKTPSIILEFSSVLRYVLYDCKEDYVPLEKEIEHLKNYTALNKLQIEDRGTINFVVNGSSLSNFKIAPLILNVFVENAFKHSSSSQTNNILIDMLIDISESGVLTLTCKNNFNINSNLQKLSKGIGLENVKKRLSLLYPEAHHLKINEKENHFSVKLTIKLKSKK